MMRNRTIFVVIVFLFIVSPLRAEILYNITDLGGGEWRDLNNYGKVVGSWGYWENGQMTGGGASLDSFYAINDSGQMTGKQYPGHAFVQDAGGNKTWLPFLDGQHLYPTAINNSGQVVGHNQSRVSLFRWDAANGIESLVSSGYANGINNNGEIAGTLVSGGYTWAFIWDEGNGFNTFGTIGSHAFGINDSGQVVGYIDSSLVGKPAFIWDENNGTRYLDSLYPDGDGSWNGVTSMALGINNDGVVVGNIRNGFTQTEHAVIWNETGEVTDLGELIDPELGWDLNKAVAINDNGWIVGQGINLDGFEHGFLLTPIPVPSPPTANTNGPYTIYVGDMLTLDANGSTDPDNDIVSYMWDLDDDSIFETDAGNQQICDVSYSYLQLLGLLINYEYTIHLKVTDSEGQSDIANSTLIIIPKPAIKVVVDIKPGSCPNPVNTKSSGVLPVAILGSADYDITTIDSTSIRLAGVEALRSSYEDVATSMSDSNDCNCIENGPDGWLDLTLKFKTQAIVRAIDDVNDGDILELELAGVLYDPIPFEVPIAGGDCILIKNKHRTFNKADINKDGITNMADFAIISNNWLDCTDCD